MSKSFFALAFAAGLAILAWTGVGFIGTSAIALVMTAAIAGVYLLGAFELRQFRAATAGLATALDQLAQAPASLAAWLAHVPPALREAVRLRVEGERVALPGPALTPYLVGLLVMLGMLGTFLGMVVTFQGAVFAMQGSTDLQAVRSALAEPIKGLGLSFGTSVAGVATSAMLGLMSAIARRERLDAARRLDGQVAGVLLPFSLAHQRQETFRSIQAQSRALPEVAATLQALLERIERRSEQLDGELLQRHDALQRQVTQSVDALARNVGTSLQESLAAGARAAGETITPVVSAAMAQFVQETHRAQARLGESQHERMDQLATLWRTELAALRDAEDQRGRAAVERLGELQAAVAQHLATLGAALEEPLTRLLHTAAEVPQAASGVITQLRAEMGRMAERDNLALQERTTLLERMDVLLQALDAQAGEAGAAAAQVRAGAVEVASLADAFGQSVQLFQAGNDKLVETLQRVEASLVQSTARSDEQLAYYVAQAREVIDLSIASQQGMVDNLRRLQERTLAAEERP